MLSSFKNFRGATLVALLALIPGVAAGQEMRREVPRGGPEEGTPTLQLKGSATAGPVTANFRNMPERWLVFLAISPNPGSTNYGPFPFQIGSPIILCAVGSATASGDLWMSINVPTPRPQELRGRTFHYQGAAIHSLTRPNLITLTNTAIFTFG